MKVVLDTNVLVSGMINPVGAPGRLVDMIRGGALLIVVDERIVTEYADVLRRPGMRQYFSVNDVKDVLDFLDHNAEHMLVTGTVVGLPDPDDAPFLEVALAAVVPLITGNKRHFPSSKRFGCVVVSPDEFIHRVALPAAPPEGGGG